MNKTLKPAIVGLVIIAVLIFLHFVGWLRPLEGLVVKALSPLQSSMLAVSGQGRSFYDAWLRKKDLLAETNELREQLKNSQIDSSRIKALEEENELLKQELGFVNEKELKYIAAKIIGGVSDPYSQTVIINEGRQEGLVEGLAVVTENGVLIGKLTEVGDGFSKVLLLTDSKSKVAATVQNSDRTAGLVEGQFGLSFSMTNIPRNQEVKEGDTIVTSGLEGQIPKNLLIARVESVKEVASEIFKTAILKPIASFANLSRVLVIIP
jgi:rod shape-determining protein MreC